MNSPGSGVVEIAGQERGTREREAKSQIDAEIAEMRAHRVRAAQPGRHLRDRLVAAIANVAATQRNITFECRQRQLTRQQDLAGGMCILDARQPRQLDEPQRIQRDVARRRSDPTPEFEHSFDHTDTHRQPRACHPNCLRTSGRLPL
ncbi:hypothetical protein MWT96_18815 [Prescottella equi]|nr:hypothetical protein [Prescottella equi]UPH37005.1 hypothetical protein GS533_002875 [Prescottella equi]UPH40541.1 hypothetical protein MWT96_18815 [Prescottella equi]